MHLVDLVYRKGLFESLTIADYDLNILVFLELELLGKMHKNPHEVIHFLEILTAVPDSIHHEKPGGNSHEIPQKFDD